MPLTTVAKQCSPDLWGVTFQMVSHDGAIVICRVTRNTLDKLSGDEERIIATEQIPIFLSCRKVIESIASQKYDVSNLGRELVLVEPEDLERAGGLAP